MVAHMFASNRIFCKVGASLRETWYNSTIANGDTAYV